MSAVLGDGIGGVDLKEVGLFCFTWSCVCEDVQVRCVRFRDTVEFSIACNRNWMLTDVAGDSSRGRIRFSPRGLLLLIERGGAIIQLSPIRIVLYRIMFS